MNTAVNGNALLWQLVRKDWHFVRWPMVAYTLAGLLGAGLLAVGHQAASIVGISLLISAVIIIGVHFVFGSVVFERSKQTLPLIMSLPITFVQYTMAKLLSNIGGFTVAWLVLLATTLVLIGARETLPDGLMPFAVIVLLELFAAFVIVLGVALVTESETWTIVVLTILNVGVSIFMNLVGSIETIGAHIDGPVPVWNTTALTIIAIELTVIVAAIGLTLALQARKTDFL